MAGTDTVRGIGYQQAQAVLTVVTALDDPTFAAVRIEGVSDVVDLELLDDTGTVTLGQQMKTRGPRYTWSGGEVLSVLGRWAALEISTTARFEFLTDGRLGPSGEMLHSALQEVARGDSTRLEDFVGTGMDEALTHAAARCSIVHSGGGVGAILAAAARQVAPLIPGVRNAQDALDVAQASVLALFADLFEAGSDGDPGQRVRSREAVAACLGVPSETMGPYRWPDLGAELISVSAALALPGVECRLGTINDHAGASAQFELGSVPLTPMALASDGETRRPILLVGRTGSGKSTCCTQLRGLAARDGRVVVVAHAEAYLPGRLAAAVADAVSEVLGQSVPISAARQMLSDPAVIVVLDGVSEVPRELQMALADELRAPVASGAGAATILVGRDAAVLRSVLPSSVDPITYVMEPLDREHQQALVELKLAQRPDHEADPANPREAIAVIARVEEALGDASGNPMLLGLAVDLLVEGTTFQTRADLYHRSTELMAQRSGVAGLNPVTAVLGMAFARLLNEGRRFADQVDWALVVHKEAQLLADRGARVNGQDVLKAANRCGLVVPLGASQTVVPVHDSFADYMAGSAHAKGLAPLPPDLQPGDDQRILFAAELGGLSDEVIDSVTRDRPFLIPMIARNDQRTAVDATPHHVTRLLANILGLTQNVNGDIALPDGSVAVLYRAPDGRVVATLQRVDSPRWAPWPDAGLKSILATVNTSWLHVLPAGSGPLVIVDELWQAHLSANLASLAMSERQAVTNDPRHPPTVQAAREALERHARRTKDLVDSLVVSCSPPGRDEQLAAAVGPSGLFAIIHPSDHTRDSPMGPSWPVSYRSAPNVEIQIAESKEDADPVSGLGFSVVEHLLSQDPAVAATTKVLRAMRNLTVKRWVRV